MHNKIVLKLDKSLAVFVDSLRGPESRGKFIEDSLRRLSNMFEAVWFFSDEMPRSKTRGKSRSLRAIKHIGFIDVQPDSLEFYGYDFEHRFSVPLKSISGLKVSYDLRFKKTGRLKRPNPPLHFNFGEKTIYVFTRGFDDIKFKGDNKRFIKLLRDNSR